MVNLLQKGHISDTTDISMPTRASFFFGHNGHITVICLLCPKLIRTAI